MHWPAQEMVAGNLNTGGSVCIGQHASVVERIVPVQRKPAKGANSRAEIQAAGSGEIRVEDQGIAKRASGLRNHDERNEVAELVCKISGGNADTIIGQVL